MLWSCCFGGAAVGRYNVAPRLPQRRLQLVLARLHQRPLSLRSLGTRASFTAWDCWLGTGSARKQQARSRQPERPRLL